MKDTTRTPHVAPEWASAFIVELRMLDVAGDRIGAALADVETHCADAGESAAEAFGDAVAYARSLALPRQDSRISPSEIIGHGAGLIGIFLTAFALGAWASHEPASVTLGLVISALVLLAALGALVRWPEATLRALMARPWLAILANVVVIGGVAAALLLLDTSVVDLPALPVAGVGVLLVAFSTFSSLRSGVFTADDRVLGPEGADGVGSLELGRRFTVLSALGPWVPAIATVILGLAIASSRLF